MLWINYPPCDQRWCCKLDIIQSHKMNLTVNLYILFEQKLFLAPDISQCLWIGLFWMWITNYSQLWWICLSLITLSSCQIYQNLQTFAFKMSVWEAKLINNNHTRKWKIHPQILYLQNTTHFAIDISRFKKNIWRHIRIFYVPFSYCFLSFNISVFFIFYIINTINWIYFNVKRFEILL